MRNSRGMGRKLLPVLFLLVAGAFLFPIVARPAVADEAPAKYAGVPYKGKAVLIPGTIEAEEYDVAPGAANGISFNYNSPAKKGPLRTTGDSIGLARFGDGHVTTKGEPEATDQVYAGWTHEGEWFKYSVHVAEAGLYRIGGHFSAANKDAALSFSFSPTLTTGPVVVPTTEGYQPGVEVYHVWEKLDDLTEINLPEGDCVLTVKIEKGGGLNLDWFTFTKINEPQA